jgi:C4-dicarboxylate transporter, DctM subunit
MVSTAEIQGGQVGTVRPPNVVGAALSGAVNVLNAGGTVLVLIVMAITNADIFSRLLFNYPLTGVPLFTEAAIVAIMFLQLAATIGAGRMTRSDLMIESLLYSKLGAGLVLSATYNLAGIALMAIVFTFAAPAFEQAWTQNLYAGIKNNFTLPEWPIALVILIGLGASICQYMAAFASDIGAIYRAADDPLERRRAVGMLGVVALFCVAIALCLNGFRPTPAEIGLLSVALVIIFVYIGVHIAVALGLLSFVGIWGITGSIDVAGQLVSLSVAGGLRLYEFGVIPLFTLMGLLVSVSGVGRDTYEVANNLFKNVKGGLGHATVGANAVFAAVTGSSIASASVFTKVSVPEMLRIGYSPRFAVGVVAGSSVLGMLIPPSMLMIIYGLIAETSVGKLFTAGILPGILLALVYCVAISLAARFAPRYVTIDGTFQRATFVRLGLPTMLRKAAPIVGLIGVVLGGIYGGVFTAIEAGAAGTLGALAIALGRRQLTWRSFWGVLIETGHVTAAISFLLVCAFLYTKMLALSGIPNLMEVYIRDSGFGYFEIMTIFVVVILLLGTILDSGSIILITVPLILPVLAPFNVDLVWLGIVTVIAVEIGLLTPPFGISCFVVHASLRGENITLKDIFIGAIPFAIMMTLVLILVIAFPSIALYLVY